MRNSKRVFGKDGRRYDILTLTPDLARRFSTQLLALHDLIPHVAWTDRDLLAEIDQCSGRAFYGKWSLSLCALHDGVPVAFLVAYIRSDNLRRQQRGLYIHRLAVAREHQRNHLGTRMTEAAIHAYFATAPGLSAVTVQTNDELDNQGVIEFYRSLGFKNYSKVPYSDKQDVLLRLRRPRRIETEACLNRSEVFLEHVSMLLASAPTASSHSTSGQSLPRRRAHSTVGRLARLWISLRMGRG